MAREPLRFEGKGITIGLPHDVICTPADINIRRPETALRGLKSGPKHGTRQAQNTFKTGS